MARHGGVQRREAILLEQIMEGGDVTESDEPFGMLPELGKIQFAYQMHGSVTAPIISKSGFKLSLTKLIVSNNCPNPSKA
jgi:hypothetical protein